jgi:RimJ/RimL family protein N-acetyltransferase
VSTIAHKVRLELLAEHHLPDVEALIAEPSVLRHTRIPEPPPPGFARHWLERYEVKRRNGVAEIFAVLDDDDTFLGLAMAPEIIEEERDAELGYIVASAARGRGVATEMLNRLTRWAFDELGMERLTLLISIDNPASERVAEKCGYVREGVARSLYLKDGKRGDATVWSRLPSDPEPDPADAEASPGARA